MRKAAKTAVVGKGCVACGCCVKACPKQALRIYSGVVARVDSEVCVGCGKCAKICPAAVIAVMELEAEG